jgi:hypothetical protein
VPWRLIIGLREALADAGVDLREKRGAPEAEVTHPQSRDRRPSAAVSCFRGKSDGALPLHRW